MTARDASIQIQMDGQTLILDGARITEQMLSLQNLLNGWILITTDLVIISMDSNQTTALTAVAIQHLTAMVVSILMETVGRMLTLEDWME